MNSCIRVRQISWFIIEYLVVIQQVLLLYKHKPNIFLSKYHFSMSLFLFIITNCYVDQYESRNRVPVILPQLYFLLESWNVEISREWNLLNKYLPVLGDLFLDVKVSYSKANKVRGHLLIQYTILEIGLLIVLIIRTLLL